MENYLKNAGIISKLFLAFLICTYISIGGIAQASEQTESMAGEPFSAPYLTFPVGSTSDVILGFGQVYIDPADGRERSHSGIDIAADAGSTITAASAGLVTYIGRTVGTSDSAINCLTITDLNGNKITYRPVSSSLSVGQKVMQGDNIGVLNAAGDPSSNVSHLNLSVRDTEGAYLDPLPLLLVPVVEEPVSSKPALSEHAEMIKGKLLDLALTQKTKPAPIPSIAIPDDIVVTLPQKSLSAQPQPLLSHSLIRAKSSYIPLKDKLKTSALQAAGAKTPNGQLINSLNNGRSFALEIRPEFDPLEIGSTSLKAGGPFASSAFRSGGKSRGSIIGSNLTKASKAGQLPSTWPELSQKNHAQNAAWSGWQSQIEVRLFQLLLAAACLMFMYLFIKKVISRAEQLIVAMIENNKNGKMEIVNIGAN